jgi:D-aminoacyl-tRNA deacylase
MPSLILFPPFNNLFMVKVVLQRVKRASVSVNEELVSSIQKGILCLLGINKEDNLDKIQKMARKVCNVRLWSEEKENVKI